MDNAALATIDIVIKKAKTTSLFNGAPSDTLYNASQPGPQGDHWSIVETNGGIVVFEGGVPIIDKDGYWIGSVGVGGGGGGSDTQIAKMAAAAVLNDTATYT